MSRRGPKLGTRGNTPVRRSYHKNPNSNEPGCPGGGGVHIPTLTPAPFLTRGACATKGEPDWWHPTSRIVSTIRDAIAICQECPVKFQCLEWAFTNRIPDGIYGGMDPWQRAEMRSP